MSKVTITSDDMGNVITVSQNNPEYGFIRVEQVANQINEDGWFKLSRRSALIKGKVEDLKQANYFGGKELPGKIVIKESLTPFDETNPDRHMKIAGSTGIVCTVDDQPIYRNTFYTTNPNAEDQLIMHDESCKQEIRNVQMAQNVITKNITLKDMQPAEL